MILPYAKPLLFGTGGWRAIIGDDFTKENLQRLTCAIARQMRAEGAAETGFCIGYDRRFLSEEAALWAAEVMAGEGIHCYVIRRESPTPLIMFTVKRYALRYSMAVTASHNPAIYNGVKLFTAGGQDASEAVTRQIEARVAALRPEDVRVLPYEEGIQSGIIEEINPLNAYIDSIIQVLDMEAIKKRALRVVLDPMYGVSKTSLQTILITARCDVEVIHERRDTLFGGRLPTPNVDTLNSLRQFVLEKHCDIGIATDGDADRVGIIDDTGRFIHPNEILVLLYYYLMKHKGWRGPVVRNIATTHLLDRVAEDFGQLCYEVPVGFKHISAKMAEVDAIIGGESSGGLTVKGHIQGKDGIYAAVLLIEMLAKTGKNLSEVYREITLRYGNPFMVETDYRFSAARKEALHTLLFEEKRLPAFSQTVESVSYLDGCKVYFKNGGWLITRFSGTEPLLRIFCEMSTEKEAWTLVEEMKAFLGL